MEILIISGMSGAGKSRAAICLEDSGYYIVDNLPAEMMVKFAEFCAAAGAAIAINGLPATGPMKLSPTTGRPVVTASGAAA